MELQVQGKVSVGSYRLFNYFVKNSQELEIQHEPVIATFSTDDNVYQHKILSPEAKGISHGNSKISKAKRAKKDLIAKLNY